MILNWFRSLKKKRYRYQLSEFTKYRRVDYSIKVYHPATNTWVPWPLVSLNCCDDKGNKVTRSAYTALENAGSINTPVRRSSQIKVNKKQREAIRKIRSDYPQTRYDDLASTQAASLAGSFGYSDSGASSSSSSSSDSGGSSSSGGGGGCD